ncbi:MAG TPA: AAA family ATPase [Bacteroidetes bacterium]|nr:AAA family ATPase [Bacteroidota bacterium]
MQIYSYEYTLNNAADDKPVFDEKKQAYLREHILASEWLVLRDAGFCELFLFAESSDLPADMGAVLQKCALLPENLEFSEQKRSGREAIERFLHMVAGLNTHPTGRQYSNMIRAVFNQPGGKSSPGPVFNRLFQKGIWLHEKIRLETDYFRFALDEKAILQELAEKIWGELNTISIHVIGWTIETNAILDMLHKAGCRRFVFFCDSKARTTALTQTYGGENRDAFTHVEPEADMLLIFKPSGDDALPDKKMLAERMSSRNNAPLLVVDWTDSIATLKQIHKLYNVFAYSRSELSRSVEQNRETQHDMLQLIGSWVHEEIVDFDEWLRSDSRHEFAGMIGSTPAMQKIFELISRIAQTNITVLIDGESGTGKELVARAIHTLSRRAQKPFVVVNCGAIPENLLESELFGHARGAFTGAVKEKKGLFEIANHGTLLLDEVAELPLSLQVKLLRFLQGNEIKPVGSNQTLKLDVRVIAATNKDLAQMVEKGCFRSDLYYRLNVLQLTLPALRDRKEDIIPLTVHFLRRFSRQVCKDIEEISEEARRALISYPWPGNIRELENVIERAVALSTGNMLSIYDLPEHVQNSLHNYLPAQHTRNSRLTLKEMERDYILETLNLCDWDYELACKQLGIGRTTLWRKLKEYGVEGGRKK